MYIILHEHKQTGKKDNYNDCTPTFVASIRRIATLIKNKPYKV